MPSQRLCAAGLIIDLEIEDVADGEYQAEIVSPGEIAWAFSNLSLAIDLWDGAKKVEPKKAEPEVVNTI